MTGHAIELNDSAPDLVVERGTPPRVPQPGPPGSVPQPASLSRRDVAIVLAFLFGPVLVAFIVRFVTTQGPWAPLTGLWVVAIGFLLLAGWFIDRSNRLLKAHSAAGYVPLRELEAENLQATIGIGFGVIAEFVAVASFEPWMGVALTGLLLVWILLCFLPPLRRFEGGSSIQVACSPEAAFGLVSDPQNWRLWTPELESVESSEVPVRLGTVVHSRGRVQGRLLLGDERLTVFDPPSPCGSEVLDVRGTGSDQYEIAATGGGTLITYKFRQIFPVSQAALGGIFNRRKPFLERWRKKMQRIKQLLEEGGAGSV